MIRQLFSELSAIGEFQVDHLPFNFSLSFSNLRRLSFHKLFEVLRVWSRMIGLRCGGPVDLLWYPAGGPQTVPVIRDILLLPVLSAFAKKTVIHFHAAGIADRLGQKPGLLGNLLRLATSRANMAIVMTKFNRRDPEALGIHRIKILPHRMDDANPSGLLPESKRDSANFLYVGHLYDQKGTPQLLRAFSRVIKLHPEAHLTLIGDYLSPFSEFACRAMLKSLELEQHVTLAGVKIGTEKDAFFRRSNCFVFPTVAPYESFGLVLIEAMMWALPIVATNWRGNRDVLGAEPGGICFDPDPPLDASIEKALLEFLREPDRWSAWGEANRQCYVEFFRTENTDLRYRSLLAALLNAREDLDT